MKVSTATLFVFASLVSSSAAFITTQPATFSATSSSVMFAGVELAPEPEGGEEISTIGVSLPGSRMKNMGENTELKSDVGQVFNFWMTATAQGDSIKRYRTEILKQSAKKANFPGFRKGQVPPYAQPQITGFALQEAIINTCESAVAAYGLKALSGSDGSVDVKENVQEVCKTYKVGDDLVFTGTFAATFDPDKLTQTEEPASEGEEEA